MIRQQNTKKAVLLKQQAATNGATLTSDQLDCIGYDYVTLTLIGTTSDNATNNPATLKVQESDTTDATNFGDITAFVGDGVGGFTIPSSPTATTTAPFAELNINRIGRKRYLRALVSPVTTQTFTLLAELGRPEQAPTSTTDRNVAVVVND
jgi:hypothetical protein